VGGLLAAMLVGAASAAPLADRPASPEAAAPAGPGGTLDRTLQVDTEAAQRDVEVLMQTRTTAEGDAPRPLPVARGAIAPRAGGAPAAAAHPVSGDDAAMPGNDAAARAPVPGWLRTAALFLRENRLWLAAGMGLLALLVLARLLQRRLARPGSVTSEPRLQEPRARRRQHPERQRSPSRRG